MSKASKDMVDFLSKTNALLFDEASYPVCTDDPEDLPKFAKYGVLFYNSECNCFFYFDEEDRLYFSLSVEGERFCENVSVHPSFMEEPEDLADNVAFEALIALDSYSGYPFDALYEHFDEVAEKLLDLGEEKPD